MSDVYPMIDMSTNRRVPVIFGYIDDAYNIELKDFPRYATGLMKVETMRTHTAEDGSVSYTYDHQFFYFKPCADVFAGKYIKDYYPNEQSGFLYKTTKAYGWCVDWQPGDLQNFGKSSDIVNQYLYFNLLPCSLDSNCASEEELSRFTVILGMGEEVLDYSNKDEPLKFSFNADDYNIVDTKTFTFTQYKLMWNMITDTRDFPFPEQTVVQYSTIQKAKTSVLGRDPTQLSCTKQQIEAKTLECVPYLQHWYISGGVTETVTRGYKGVLDTLGGIGGLREVIYFAAFVVYMFFDKKSQRASLVSKIYGLDEEKLDVASKDPEKAKSGKTGGCCKKKKKRIELVDQAYEKIEQNLDIVAFLRSLQVLDILTNLFFTQEQLDLIPLASLKKDLADKSVITRGIGRTLSEVPESESPEVQKKKYSIQIPELKQDEIKQNEESLDCTLRNTHVQDNQDITINELMKDKPSNQPADDLSADRPINQTGIPKYLRNMQPNTSPPRSLRRVELSSTVQPIPKRSNKIMPNSSRFAADQQPAKEEQQKIQEHTFTKEESDLWQLCRASTRAAWTLLPNRVTGLFEVNTAHKAQHAAYQAPDEPKTTGIESLRREVDHHLWNLLSQANPESRNPKPVSPKETSDLKEFRSAVYSLLPGGGSPRKPDMP